MIEIKPSSEADSRTCDPADVSKETLLRLSRQHIADVGKGIAFFVARLTEAASEHDYDKLTTIDHFYDNFVTKFQEDSWWVNHRKIHRHHLNYEDGVPDDVDLVDVIEHVVDCVMAGMARKGEVYPVELSSELLQRALINTQEKLQANVKVVQDER